MKFPNKIIRYSESAISKFSSVLFSLRESKTIVALFNEIREEFDNVADFVDTLDCLYALGKINYNFETRRVSLCC